MCSVCQEPRHSGVVGSNAQILGHACCTTLHGRRDTCKGLPMSSKEVLNVSTDSWVLSVMSKFSTWTWCSSWWRMLYDHHRLYILAWRSDVSCRTKRIDAGAMFINQADWTSKNEALFRISCGEMVDHILRHCRLGTESARIEMSHWQWRGSAPLTENEHLNRFQ